MSDLIVHAYTPSANDYAWTFGGVPPVARVAAGTVLELFSEDAFAGRVRGIGDLVSEVIEFPYVNPQTGPFYIEGAEPGDTLAVHFVSIEPARDWAASTTVPLFGALTSRWSGSGSWTRPAGCAASSPASVSTQWTYRWTPCTVRSGSPRRTWRPARPSYRICTAGTWTRRRCASA
jgi:hypothetical protein